MTRHLLTKSRKRRIIVVIRLS